MKPLKKIALFGAAALAFASILPLQAAEKHLTILFAVPGLDFPFFVHMADAIKAEANKVGGIDIIVSDGQRSSTKETADVEAAITKGVDGIVISPNDVDALAPAIQEAVDAKIPLVTVDRRVNKVPGLLAHVGADNVKGGEAQGQLIEKLFPNGANVMNLQGQSGASPAIDRNKGLHNVLDQAKDKYKFVFEDTAGFDRSKGLAMTESALAGMSTPPDVIDEIYPWNACSWMKCVSRPGAPEALTAVDITSSSSGNAFSVTSARGRFSSPRGQWGLGQNVRR